MFPNRNYCLHFVADLRRAVHCLLNNNAIGAKTFLDHAEKIYKEQLMQNDVQNQLHIEFDPLWLSLYNQQVPLEVAQQGVYADKLLTFSSIIFTRTMSIYASN